MTTERVALYARQSVQEDQGIAQQLEAMHKRAVAEDWIVAGEYVDNFTSATKTRGDETSWARMLADVDVGKIDTIVAVKSARLLRRLEDALEITAPRRHVRVVTFDGIDTASHYGRVILVIMTSIAEAEIEEKEARALPFRASRRAAGHPTSGLVAYGYQWIPELHRDERGTRFVVVPEEAVALRYMSRELLGGADLGAIARAMNDGAAMDEGRRPLPESSRRTRAGVKWTSTTVRRMLASPFPAALLPPAMPEGIKYRADRYTLSECTPGAWEPILDEDAVAAARGRLFNPSRLSHDGNTHAKWLLSRVGKCGRCEGPLRKIDTRTTARVRAYRCTKGCFQRPAALIEEYVEYSVVKVLSEPGLLTWADTDGLDLGALRLRREALRVERAEWFQRVRVGKLTPMEWDELSARWDAELVQLDADIAEAVSGDPLASFVGTEDVRALWDSLSVARRRAVLEALLFSVEVHPVGKGKRVTTLRATEPTVTMNWRRAERRVTFDVDRTVTAVEGRVSPDARDAIAAALSTP
jgi:DNA invertase Pin-like site-specific DNA recombinase